MGWFTYVLLYPNHFIVCPLIWIFCCHYIFLSLIWVSCLLRTFVSGLIAFCWFTKETDLQVHANVLISLVLLEQWIEISIFTGIISYKVHRGNSLTFSLLSIETKEKLQVQKIWMLYFVHTIFTYDRKVQSLAVFSQFFPFRQVILGRYSSELFKNGPTLKLYLSWSLLIWYCALTK